MTEYTVTYIDQHDVRFGLRYSTLNGAFKGAKYALECDGAKMVHISVDKPGLSGDYPIC